MMTDEDQVHFSSTPDLEKMDQGFEGDAEQDYEKARDSNLPISERGDAFTRICEVASRSQGTTATTRKAALNHVIQLSPELGTAKSANILAELLFDRSLEIRTIIFANVSTFIQKTDDKNFEAIIYSVVEELSGANEQPSSVSNEELGALQIAAKHLMRSYATQFFSALFAPSSISKGSLKWLAANYPKLKSEIFGDGSEAGTKADRALMAALKSASAELTDTINKAMQAMDAMNTVVKSVQSVLGIYSDLLRVSGEPGIVIVSTALTSNLLNQEVRVQQDQPRTPVTANTEYPKRRTRDSNTSQVSPKTVIPNRRLFSTEIEMRNTVPAAPVHRPYTSRVDIRDDIAELPYSSSPPRISTLYPSTPQHQRSSSAPPTPTPSKRTFGDTEMISGGDTELKRSRREANNSKTPSPTHNSNRNGNGANQGGVEPHRGGPGRGRYQGKNFIPGYIPNYRGRSNYRGRDTYRSSYSWRGRQPQWGDRGERGDYQSNYRSAEYPSRMNYE